LDKRRPQVMIEARIVIIDTSDDYTLGVEVSGGDRSGASRLFAFSSYGLSNVTAATGSLAITPGRGFNATLVDPSTADLVVRALATHRRARVLSSPKLLVDDNAEGTLESVNEVPFTSVNASQTVATTSFAGFAKAGTTITVTPTISEAKHVNMDYVVTLNSFTGDGADGVPPPRQTNEVRSRVTVPDGYTIIVGGLTQKSSTNSLSGIPYLEKIPIIRELSSLSSSNSRDNSLFVFLRPIILEEDKFRDLRYLSRRSALTANEGHQFPASSPLLMK
jgi:general secretion pathway protein D